jgi:DNA repair exonuclease SbcCD nuclease subunit
MVAFAKQNDVRVIIIAGDLFDTKNGEQKTIKKRISYIISQAPQIDFLYLHGNHDEDVDFASADNLENLKLFCKKEWKSYSYGNVEIYGREFGDKVEADTYNLNPDSKKINIITLHGQVAEYIAKKDAPVISLPKFVNHNIDYIALGHIHSYKIDKLDKRGQWCYSGCLEGRGFDECGEKGFVLLDIDENADTAKIESGNAIKCEFHSVAKRTIHEISVDISGIQSYNGIMDKIKEAVSEIPAKDIVEVMLTGEISEDAEIETESYKNALASEFYIIRVKNKTVAKIEYEKYQNDVSLKGEFIRLVNSQKDLSDEDKAEIIMTGIKALAGRLNKDEIN